MAAPKLRLWAKLIQTGRHESYEVPPPIPLITGPCASQDKKDTLTEAFSGAASAIAKALQPKTPPTTSIDDNCPSISPLKVASIRQSCLEDLKQLKNLLDDGILTEGEFLKEKNKY